LSVWPRSHDRITGMAGEPSRRYNALTAMNVVLPFSRSCLLLALICGGCWSPADNSVVVYTALDSEFSEPLLDQFTADSGVAVLPKFDVESTKTVGLYNALLAERARPRADLFWNNEILNTLRLRDAGLLEAYVSPMGQQYPAAFRDPQGRWYGFAARARVLVVNTSLVPKGERPTSIEDLADPKWKGRIGIAKPLFGTTATHAACLFAFWGEERAKQFFESLKANEVQILAGNKQVALAVASGQLAFGLTDTDDAVVEKVKGQRLEIVYPDREPDQMGTLFIPNTLAIIKGGPHPEQARKLIDFLLSPDIEARLAVGESAQIPLHPDTKATPRVETPHTVKAMPVDFDAAVRQWENAAQFIRDEFASGK
jgi:iron(III) transport system substrate-binding protein